MMNQPDDEADEAFAAETLTGAIENQLASNDPKETRAAYNWLTLGGYSHEEALHLMAQVLAREIRLMLRDQQGFDRQRYGQALRALPELPDDDGPLSNASPD